MYGHRLTGRNVDLGIIEHQSADGENKTRNPLYIDENLKDYNKEL